jgi:hypothetical protein
MAKITAQEVQAVIDEVKQLAETIVKAGDAGRGHLQDVTYAQAIKAMASNAEVEFDATVWEGLTDQDRDQRAKRLKQVRNTLRHILGQDGPTSPSHIMYWDYAGNGWIVVCALLGFVLIAGLIWGIRSEWDVATNAGWARTQAHASELVRQATSDSDAALAQELFAAKALEDLRGKSAPAAELAKAEATLKTAQDNTLAAQTRVTRARASAKNTIEAAKEYSGIAGPTEGAILTMVVMWGALGGSLHLLRSLAAFVGNRQLVRSWLLHYFTLPFIGGALAAIVYLLLRVGLVSPSSTTGDGSAIANLNVIAIYGFAALSGLFAKAASDKLAELFGTLFRTTAPAQKDPIAEKVG